MMRSAPLRRHARRVAAVAVMLAAVTLAAACSSLRRGGGQPSATIIFTNESLEQAAVYLVGSGFGFTRIGTVFAGQTDTLTVPASLTTGGMVNIVARLFTRREVPQTGAVSLYPGEQYRVRLPPDAKLLSFLPAGS